MCARYKYVIIIIIIYLSIYQQFWFWFWLKSYVWKGQYLPIGLSLASDVNLQIMDSSTVDHNLNCDLHCSTATADVHSTMHRFLIVQAAVTPTNVLPAPETRPND